MNTDRDNHHPGEYRLQLLTANNRKAGHEYLRTKASAFKRQETLRKHGYRVLLFLVDQQGELQALT